MPEPPGSTGYDFISATQRARLPSRGPAQNGRVARGDEGDGRCWAAERMLEEEEDEDEERTSSWAWCASSTARWTARL